jgi:hypothetical protein
MLFCAWSTTVRLCYGSYLQEFSGILMGIYGVLAETERSARRVCKHFPATFFARPRGADVVLGLPPRARASWCADRSGYSYASRTDHRKSIQIPGGRHARFEPGRSVERDYGR